MHWSVEGHVVDDSPFAEVYEQRSAICVSQLGLVAWKKVQSNAPSSNERSRLPSGDKAIQATFFLFSNESVLDLLLRPCQEHLASQ